MMTNVVFKQEQNPVSYKYPDKEILLSFSLHRHFKEIESFVVEYALTFAATTKQFHAFVNPVDHHKPPSMNLEDILEPVMVIPGEQADALLLRLLRQRLSIWFANHLLDDNFLEQMIRSMYTYAMKSDDRIHQHETMDFFLIPSTHTSLSIYPNTVYLDLPATSLPANIFKTFTPSSCFQDQLHTKMHMPAEKKNEGCLVAVFSCSLEFPRLQTASRTAPHIEIQLKTRPTTSASPSIVSSAVSSETENNQEMQYLNTLITVLVRSQIHLILCQQRIHPYLRTTLANQFGISCVSNISIRKISHMLGMTGARLFSELPPQFVYSPNAIIPLHTLGLLKTLSQQSLFGRTYVAMQGFSTRQEILDRYTYSSTPSRSSTESLTPPDQVRQVFQRLESTNRVSVVTTIVSRVLPQNTVCISGCTHKLRQRIQDGFSDGLRFFQHVLKAYATMQSGGGQQGQQQGQCVYSIPSHSFLREHIRIIDAAKYTSALQRGYRFYYDDEAEDEAEDDEEEAAGSEYIPVIREIAEQAIVIAEKEWIQASMVTEIVAIN